MVRPEPEHPRTLNPRRRGFVEASGDPGRIWGELRSVLADELEPLPAAGSIPHLLTRTSRDAIRQRRRIRALGVIFLPSSHSTDGPRTGSVSWGPGSNELVGSPVQSALCTRGDPLAGDVPSPTRSGPRRSRNIR